MAQPVEDLLASASPEVLAKALAKVMAENGEKAAPVATPVPAPSQAGPKPVTLRERMDKVFQKVMGVPLPSSGGLVDHAKTLADSLSIPFTTMPLVVEAAEARAVEMAAARPAVAPSGAKPVTLRERMEKLFLNMGGPMPAEGGLVEHAKTLAESLGIEFTTLAAVCEAAEAEMYGSDR